MPVLLYNLYVNTNVDESTGFWNSSVQAMPHQRTIIHFYDFSFNFINMLVIIWMFYHICKYVSIYSTSPLNCSTATIAKWVEMIHSYFSTSASSSISTVDLSMWEPVHVSFPSSFSPIPQTGTYHQWNHKM